jgi:hypothetical protein
MAWVNPVTRTAAVLLTQCFSHESTAGVRFMQLAFDA